MLILPAFDELGGGLTHHLPCLPEREITRRLGVFPIIDDSPDGKVTREWRVRIDGHLACIWDYRGERWSAFDPHEILPKALGIAYERRTA